MKLWSKTAGVEFWAHGDWHIWSIDEDFCTRKYEIHAWVLYNGNGKNIVAVKKSRKAIFRVANRIVREFRKGVK